MFVDLLCVVWEFSTSILYKNRLKLFHKFDTFYIINIDQCGNDSSSCVNDKEKAFVQGDDNAIPNGQKVVIIYGDVVRVMSYDE